MRMFFSKKTTILSLVLIILIAFSPFYFFNNFLGDLGDPIGQFIPNKILLLEYFKQGILPLINPFSFMGIPFMADMQTATFYLPDNLLFSIFPKFIAYNLSVLLHFSFITLGFYFWIDKKTKSKLIAFALALSASLTALSLNKIYFLNFFEVISYTPWILFVLTQKKPSVFFLTLLISLMIFAGHPIAFIYASMIFLPYSLLIETKKTKYLLIAIFFTFLITSIQTIPFLFLKTDSVRDMLTYSQFQEGNLNPKDLLNLIDPFYLKNPNKIEGFIYAGTFSCISLILSLLFIKKLPKKLFALGALFIVTGIILSLGGRLAFIYRIIYEIPIINLFRIPARYIILSHFGIILCLIGFFPIFLKKHKSLATTLLILIIINSIITPLLFLKQTPISEAQKNYLQTKEEINLKKIPEYFVLSSASLFPNRHYLNGINSINGYTPLIPKIFNEKFPMEAVGSFKNTNYIIDYFEAFEKIGVKYFLFPTKTKLEELYLDHKIYINDLLLSKGLKFIETINNSNLYENQSAKKFLYFTNENNKILKIDYTPSKITLTTKVIEEDYLIVNQLFSQNWEIKETNLKPEIHEELIQKYKIPKGLNKITIKYSSPYFLISIFTSLLGLCLFLIYSIKFKAWK